MSILLLPTKLQALIKHTQKEATGIEPIWAISCPFSLIKLSPLMSMPSAHWRIELHFFDRQSEVITSILMRQLRVSPRLSQHLIFVLICSAKALLRYPNIFSGPKSC